MRRRVTKGSKFCGKSTACSWGFCIKTTIRQLAYPKEDGTPPTFSISIHLMIYLLAGNPRVLSQKCDLAQCRDSKETYAMKCISKGYIVKMGCLMLNMGQFCSISGLKRWSKRHLRNRSQTRLASQFEVWISRNPSLMWTHIIGTVDQKHWILPTLNHWSILKQFGQTEACRKASWTRRTLCWWQIQFSLSSCLSLGQRHNMSHPTHLCPESCIVLRKTLALKLAFGPSQPVVLWLKDLETWSSIAGGRQTWIGNVHLWSLLNIDSKNQQVVPHYQCHITNATLPISRLSGQFAYHLWRPPLIWLILVDHVA